MRTFLSALLTLIAMAATVVAVPSMWVTERLVKENGFVAVIAPLADDRQMQQFIAEKITDQVVSQVSVRGAATLVGPVATRYTQSSQFRDDFGDLVRQQHSWLFSQASAGADGTSMRLNITPMINRAIGTANLPFSVSVDQQVEVPIADGGGLEAGRYHHVGQQITRIGYIAVAVAVGAALVALVIARRRGTVVAWLGIGGLLAAGGAWLLARATGSIVDRQIGATDSESRTVTGLAVDAVSSDLTHWATISAIAGGVAVILGIVGRVALGGPRPV